ncbi:MAG: hypothetical protein WCN92_12480, partial [Eubacteriales bacterium]
MSFGFAKLSELISACNAQGFRFEFSEELAILNTPYNVGQQVSPNRFCVHPMEGSDSLADG